MPSLRSRDLRVTGRRRHLHRWMAIALSALGAAVIVGSALPWTHHWAGGDTSRVTLSGLTFPSEWGVWTLMLGMAIIFGAVLVPGLISPHRYLFVAIPAAGGVALSAVSCVRNVPLSIGISIVGSVGAGLDLVLAASLLALATSGVAGLLDSRLRRDEQVPVGHSSQCQPRSREDA